MQSECRQAILDLWPNRTQIGVRRATANSSLVSMLGIIKFPYAALFKRGDQQSIFMDQFQGAQTLDEVMQRIQPEHFISLLDIEQQQNSSNAQPTKPTVHVIDCEKEPERCKPLYFVSETDLHNAMRTALLDEVTRMEEMIQGDRFRRLYGFISLLSDHFPTKTLNTGIENGVRRSRRVLRKRAASEGNTLKRSERFRLVFAHMKQMMEARTGLAGISANEWREQFENVKRVYGFPFPQNANWQHCAGSSAEFRGYTCGLWSTFLALTVHSYIDSIQLHYF